MRQVRELAARCANLPFPVLFPSLASTLHLAEKVLKGDMYILGYAFGANVKLEILGLLEERCPLPARPPACQPVGARAWWDTRSTFRSEAPGRGPDIAQ